MNKTIGLSFWGDSRRIADRPALTDDLRVDTCVIGAGIAGLTTAYLLAREGRSVAVLESNTIGGGMTSFTTAHAHLGCVVDTRQQSSLRA